MFFIDFLITGIRFGFDSQNPALLAEHPAGIQLLFLSIVLVRLK